MLLGFTVKGERAAFLGLGASDVGFGVSDQALRFGGSGQVCEWPLGGLVLCGFRVLGFRPQGSNPKPSTLNP